MNDYLIESQEQFDSLCQGMSTADVIAVDTEFLRVKTYYPKLCLVQIGCEQDVFCIDPLRVNLDTGAFRQVLLSEGVIKIFHSARQDIEVLNITCGVVPRSVFDTQVGAAMLGLGDQMGYAALVETVTGEKLAKAHTRTDWCSRPLSSEQIEYALDDVRYLQVVYRHLHSELSRCGRIQWVAEECALLSDPDLYGDEPDIAYRRMGHGQHLGPLGQGVLKELAAWREKISQQKDLPRNWVVKDATLAEIARVLPTDLHDLGLLEKVPGSFVQRYGDTVIDLIKKVAEYECHPEFWGRSTPLTPEQRALRKRIISYLNDVSETTGVSQSLLGPRQEVDKLVRGRRDVTLLRGWRGGLVGGELVRLLA